MVYGIGSRRALAFSLLCASLCACTPVVNTGAPPTVTSTVRPVQPAVPAPKAKVALLLPLSGAQANLGRSLLDASQLALYDTNASDIALLPIDTGDTPATASQAAKMAIEQGAKAIIGPVFGNAVESVQPIAYRANVPVLALSNNEELADANTFILGVGPADQVSRVLDYANSRNLKRIAALIPASAYGQLLEKTLRTETARLGQTLVHVESFTPGQDATLPAHQLMAALTEKGGADALFVPEGSANLASLSAALISNGFNPATTRLLGTSQWENVDVRLPILNGALFAAIPPEGRNEFRSRFSGTYGYAPANLSSIAYDSVRLALQQAQQGPLGLSANRLTNPQGFTGLEGYFRLRTDGVVDRALAIYEISPTGSRQIAPPAVVSN